ncbi:hypothetical protein ACH5RR_024042 [Cinchona calisaya]|uniref:Uncharacterized protein n=1 Tax=Cinchona calisaya TaxID=153742 RepID=A0ABD2ZFT5_9GENT
MKANATFRQAASVLLSATNSVKTSKLFALHENIGTVNFIQGDYFCCKLDGIGTIYNGRGFNGCKGIVLFDYIYKND